MKRPQQVNDSLGLNYLFLKNNNIRFICEIFTQIVAIAPEAPCGLVTSCGGHDAHNWIEHDDPMSLNVASARWR